MLWMKLDEEITKMVAISGNQAEVLGLLNMVNKALLAGVEPHRIKLSLEVMEKFAHRREKE